MTYKRLSASCLDCKQEISKNNFQKHIDSPTCRKQFVRSEEYEDRKIRSNCIKCEKFCKSHNSLTQHEIRCKGPIIKTCEYCNTKFSNKNKKVRFCSYECRRNKPL